MGASFNSYDDRPIGGNSTGHYDLSEIPLDEIEYEDDFEEVELATMDEGTVDQVKQAYYDILQAST